VQCGSLTHEPGDQQATVKREPRSANRPPTHHCLPPRSRKSSIHLSTWTGLLTTQLLASPSTSLLKCGHLSVASVSVHRLAVSVPRPRRTTCADRLVQRSRMSILEAPGSSFWHGYQISWQICLSSQANTWTDITYEWTTASSYRISWHVFLLFEANALTDSTKE